MKKIKFLAMALVALTIASCSKEKVVTDNEVVPELRVSIADGRTRVAEAGTGAENTISEYAAFAKIKATGNYECKTAAGMAHITFEGVVGGSNIYVIANAAKSGGTAPYTAGKNDYTEANIQAMSVLVTKSALNDFTTGLQDNKKAGATGDIAFGNGSAMVMTGAAPVVGVPDGDGKVNVAVALDREFARVDAEETQLAYTGSFSAEASAIATIDGTTNYIVRRVASSVVGFSKVSSITTSDKDGGNNTTEPTVLTGGYRLEYPTGLTAVVTTATTPEAKNFYVTSNFATAKTGSTVLVYEVQFTAVKEIDANTMTGQLNPITQGTKFTRYYKAYITNDAQTEFVTVKGSYYQFKNTISGWGSETEDDAINNEAVDLNVSVTIRDWDVKAIVVGME